MTGRVTLTAQQQTTIRQTVLSAANAPRVSNINFAINVGIAVPSRVRVVAISTFPRLVEFFPQFRDDSFFVVDDDIVVVDRGHRIVDVVPAGPRSRFAGSAAGLDLSQQEIIEVQQVLIEKGFLSGQATGVLDVGTHDALIAFQRQKGIEVSGSIDVRTVTALGLSGRIRATSNSGTTSGQGSNRTQQPAPQQPAQAAPQQPAQPNMGNQGANQPNAPMPQQNQSTTGQAPSNAQQPPPAQNTQPPAQNTQQPPPAQNTQQPPPAQNQPAPQGQNQPSR